VKESDIGSINRFCRRFYREVPRIFIIHLRYASALHHRSQK